MTTLVGLVCHLLSLFYPVNSLCWDEVTHLLLQFGALCECPTLLAPALKDRTLLSLVGDLLPALHQASGCVPSGSSGQAGMVERSCTKWLGLRLVLPAAVAVTMGGCQTLLHKQLVQRCGLSSLPSKGTASLGCATASNLAIADQCSALDQPAVSPDHSPDLGWTWHGTPSRTAQSL